MNNGNRSATVAGKCCLHKLQDEDTDEVFYTRVACRLLDTRSGGCSDYQNRFSRVPDCMNIRALTEDQFAWLPDTCAYRLRHEKSPPTRLASAHQR